MRTITATLVTGLMLSSWAPFAGADVFRCVEGAKTIYQDTPCKTPGQTVDMTNSRVPAGAADKANQALDRSRTSAAAQESDRRSAETAAEIGALEREVEAYERAEQAELAPLRSTLAYMNYNLPGAVWERAWAEESVRKQMQAVTDKYASKKRAARDRIVQLRAQSANAAPAPAR